MPLFASGIVPRLTYSCTYSSEVARPQPQRNSDSRAAVSTAAVRLRISFAKLPFFAGRPFQSAKWSFLETL